MKTDEKMNTLDWVNVHTHKPGTGINVADLFPDVAARPDEGTVYYSMGIHPLYIGEDYDLRLAEISRKAACGEIVAVGESGLDRNAATPLGKQMEIFRSQAEIAISYHLPMIIHCVRAYPELISLHCELQPAEGWIIHGFNNREEILRDLLKHCFYVSAGKQMMNERSNLFRLVAEIPAHRLLIETDDSDLAVETIYAKVARRRGEKIDVLKKIVFDNFNKLFNFAVPEI